MADLIKFRIKKGVAELELEGSPAVVEAALEKWWPRIANSANGGEHSIGESIDAPARGEGNRRRRQRRQASSGGESAKPKFDPTPLVNSIKEDDRFSTFEKKILHQNDRFRKIALVSCLADKPLTSGEIHKVLTMLGVKISLPAVSTALSDNSSSFITTGQRQMGGEPVRYTLTGKAKKDFEAWLRNDKQGD